MVGRPNIFSNAELKLATDNFSSQNILGEGGYGPVIRLGTPPQFNFMKQWSKYFFYKRW